MVVRENNVFSGNAAVKEFLNPDNNSFLPLVEIPESLNPFAKEKVRIFAKLMNMVPLLNVKSLPAFNMLSEAKGTNKLAGVKQLIENSSGNTVFSLSVIARLFGVERTRAIVSHEVSRGKLQLLRFFGTEIMVNEEPLCPDPGDKTSGIYIAKRMGRRKGWFNPGQYENEANPRAHERWTGPQIWKQTEGKTSVFAAGLGTTGTMLGAGGYLKKQNPRVVTVGITRLPNNPVPGVRTGNLLREITFDWKSVTDTVEEVGTKESFEKSLELCRAGIVAGPSSGFALAGLLQFFSKQKSESKLEAFRNADGEIIAVFICPDSPLPYLDDYFEYLDNSYFPNIENEELLINIPHKNPKKRNVVFAEQKNSFELDSDAAYEMIYPIPVKEVWQRLEENKRVSVNRGVIIIDIRSRGEFLHFHLPGSEQCDAYKIAENIFANAKKWKKKKVILLCAMGIRTRVIAAEFRKKGIEAYSIKGGVAEWSAKNLPRWRPKVCKA